VAESATQRQRSVEEFLAAAGAVMAAFAEDPGCQKEAILLSA
jgi:hypothetical protein